MGLFGEDSVVGLDIGSSSIKAVKMQAGKSGWEIVGAASVPMPHGAIADGVVGDPKALAPVLRQLLAKPAVKGSNLVLAANYTAAVAVRRVPVPQMTPEMLRKQMRAQPEQYGLGGSESASDFDVLAVVGEGQEAQMDTVFVSAPRVTVESRMAAAEAAGAEVLAVEIEPFALLRALVESRPALAERRSACALLDMGAVHTDVTVVRGSDYIFTRAIPFGGDGLTEVVRQSLQCSPEEAEALKRAADMRWALEAPTVEQSQTPEYQATVAIKSVLDDLLKEVKNSIMYYHAQLPEHDVDGMVDMIVLTGGTACLQGLTEYMAAAFSLQVERAGFTDGFAYPVSPRVPELAADGGPSYALAIGLALREPLALLRAPRKPVAKKAAAGKSRDKKRTSKKQSDKQPVESPESVEAPASAEESVAAKAP